MSTEMTGSGTMLDADELLHLALTATEQDRPEDSINYLKRGLELAPEDGRLYYLLGAVHAELGMYERAIEEMAKATELEPGLITAHFQLGLLHLTSGNVEAAKAAWKPLDTLDQEDPFFLFKTGLQQLVEDQFEACVETLRRGIQRNSLNEALNNDMRRVIAEAQKAMQGGDSSSEAENRTLQPESRKAGKRVLLSAYQRDEDETEH